MEGVMEPSAYEPTLYPRIKGFVVVELLKPI